VREQFSKVFRGRSKALIAKKTKRVGARGYFDADTGRKIRTGLTCLDAEDETRGRLYRARRKSSHTQAVGTQAATADRNSNRASARLQSETSLRPSVTPARQRITEK